MAVLETIFFVYVWTTSIIYFIAQSILYTPFGTMMIDILPATDDEDDDLPVVFVTQFNFSS